MSGCRWGAKLGGPSVCDAAPTPADERDELELTGTWCPEHGRRLAALAVELKLRKIRGRKPEPLTVVKTPAELGQTYRQRVAADAQQRADLLADDIVRFVKAADHYPVNRRDVAAHVGVNGDRLTRAVNRAAERGDIVNVGRAGPKLSGYYTPETRRSRTPT